MPMTTSAPGGVPVSSQGDASTSLGNASLAGRGAIERNSAARNCTAQAAGPSVSRRTLMNIAISSAAFNSIPLAVRAQPSDPDDPIFAAIEAHRAAYDAFAAVCKTTDKLESSIPRAKRQSDFDPCEGLRIVATDDPAWIAHERAYERTSNAEEDAALALVSTENLTPTGAVALIEYVLYRDGRRDLWPEDLVDDEDGDKPRTWHFFLMRQLARAFAATDAAA